jgi:hypothetical protein
MLAAAAQAAADFGAAAAAVDDAAAAAFGLNRTDLRIIGLLREAGPLSAGQLSAAAGLSPPPPAPRSSGWPLADA